MNDLVSEYQQYQEAVIDAEGDEENDEDGGDLETKWIYGHNLTIVVFFFLLFEKKLLSFRVESVCIEREWFWLKNFFNIWFW